MIQTHIERMIWWFRMHDCQATLGEILRSNEPWAYEFRARMTEARKKGIAFALERGTKASDNKYRMFEQKGQMDLAI
jgi:hypothetical protein